VSRRPDPPPLPAPRVDPQRPPGTRPVYAHVDRVSLACPDCGALSDPRLPGLAGAAYDKRTGFFRCPSCRYGAYIGVVLWPVNRGGGKVGLPADHVLSPGQAVQLRQALSYAEGEGPRRGPEGWRARQVNRQCTCGQPCGIHGGALAGFPGVDAP
jgi:hypothetical protein